MIKPVITFIGAGNMAGSLIGGLVADGYPASQIFATNPIEERLHFLRDSFNVKTTSDNQSAAEKAKIIVLAVKPTELKSVIEELRSILITNKPLVISVVTGIRCQTIAKWADDQTLEIVRCMPNTPAFLRSGTTGLYANKQVTESHKTAAESILRSVGMTLWFEQEKDLDLVTAISGSGPAYFFLIMESIIDYAIKKGLSDSQAQLLTVNTALGAARMALESDKEITALRKQVTSPGGTTEQAINVFEQGGLRELIEKALTAALDKAIDMSHSIE